MSDYKILVLFVITVILVTFTNGQKGIGDLCTLNSGGRGVCSKFDSCELDALYDEGSNPATCNWVNGDAIVCCPKGRVMNPNTPKTPTITKATQNRYQVETNVYTQKVTVNETKIYTKYKKVGNETIIKNMTVVENVFTPEPPTVHVKINATNWTINSLECEGCAPLHPLNNQNQNSNPNYQVYNTETSYSYYSTEQPEQNQNRFN